MICPSCGLECKYRNQDYVSHGYYCDPCHRTFSCDKECCQCYCRYLTGRSATCNVCVADLKRRSNLSTAEGFLEAAKFLKTMPNWSDPDKFSEGWGAAAEALVERAEFLKEPKA